MKYWQNQIKSPIIVLMVIGCQFWFLASNAYAQRFFFDGNRKKSTLYFEFIKNLIVVPIYINDKGPYNFILDTGVNPMIITDPGLKDSLLLTGLKPVKIVGFGEGDEIDAFFSNNVDVRLKNASIKAIPTVVFKEDFFNLSNYLGKKIYGLIGFNFFNSFLVDINYASKKIVFSNNDGIKKPKGEKIDLEFFDNKPYANIKILTPETGLVTVKVIVDCGASHALSLEALNEGPFSIPEPNIYGNLGVGLNGAINGRVARVSNIIIGDISFKNVVTNFPTFSEVVKKTKIKERNGNLGAAILKRFHIVFDYKNACMYLKKNWAYTEPFEHDMSGIEVYTIEAPGKRYFIGRLESGSPADQAGFLVDDEITSINFKNINTFTLDDISSLFKSYDGKNIIIQVLRKNQSLIKLIKLKRRI